MKFLDIYLLFWIFSFLGWILEVIVCSLEQRRVVNRGFLLGPYCPIYGCGGVTMLFLLPYKDSPLVCFTLALVICSVIEYVTSYLMEKIFKVRWWDYSLEAFNINGRVCLKNSIAFGLLGMLCTSYIYPFMFNILNKLNDNAIFFASFAVFIVTTIDIIVSLNAMDNIKKNISKSVLVWKNKDVTNDIKELIKTDLLNKNYLQRRIVKAYEFFSFQKEEFKERIDELKEKVKKSEQVILYGTICAIISIIILWILTKDYKIWFTILLPLGFFIDIIVYNVRRRK